MWNQTDLAVESRGLFPGISGVKESKRGKDGVVMSVIDIETDEAAKKLHKPIGRYVTIECAAIANRDQKAFERTTQALERALHGLIGNTVLSGSETVLVLGLGNRFVTPDSLGPRTVEKLLVTRQIQKSAAELAPKNIPSVAAIAPGVLGVTGIETLETARGIVSELSPSAVICIDALASRQADRISTVIQLNDSGILPGAGVNNSREALDQDSLGVPVIALGVPTVVFASTIVMETMIAINEKSGGGGDPDALFRLVDSTMREKFGEMIVTPKDVDVMIEDASRILANAINRTLYGDRLSEIAALLS